MIEQDVLSFVVWGRYLVKERDAKASYTEQSGLDQPVGGGRRKSAPQ